MLSEAREVDKVRSFRASEGSVEDSDFNLSALTMIEMKVLSKEARWLD